MGWVEHLVTRKTFAAIVAQWNEESETYLPSFLVLTAPEKVRDAVNVLVYRPTGELTQAGTAQVDGERVQFHIRSLNRPGATSMLLEGTFSPGTLDLTNALSGLLRVKRREPTPLKRPPGLPRQPTPTPGP